MLRRYGGRPGWLAREQPRLRRSAGRQHSSAATQQRSSTYCSARHTATAKRHTTASGVGGCVGRGRAVFREALEAWQRVRARRTKPVPQAPSALNCPLRAPHSRHEHAPPKVLFFCPFLGNCRPLPLPRAGPIEPSRLPRLPRVPRACPPRLAPSPSARRRFVWQARPSAPARQRRPPAPPAPPPPPPRPRPPCAEGRSAPGTRLSLAHRSSLARPSSAPVLPLPLPPPPPTLP